MKQIIYIGGVSGTGKTSLVKELCNQHPDYRGLSSSDFINPCAQPDFFTQFDAFSYEVRTEMRMNATAGLRGMAEVTEGTLLVDGHFSCFNRHTQDPEICFTADDGKLYTHLVLLDSTPEMVIRWRERDEHRKHYSGRSFDEVARQLDYEREVAKAMANEHDLQLSVIQVSDINHRVDSLLETIKTIIASTHEI